MQFSDLRKIEAEYAKRFPVYETDDHWESMVNADKNLARIALVFYNAVRRVRQESKARTERGLLAVELLEKS